MCVIGGSTRGIGATRVDEKRPFGTVQIKDVRQTAEMSTRLTAFITAAHRGGWVRADAIRRIRGGVELTLVLLRGRRGGVVASSQVRCRGVRELHVTDLNGGGIRIYDSTHLVARH